MLRQKLKRKTRVCLLSALYILGVATPVWAEDIEIFFTPEFIGVPANVLFILDVSDSMEAIVAGTSKTRLQVLKESLGIILSQSYNGLKVGFQDFADDDEVGIDFPIANINQNPAEIDPAIPADRFNTIADLLKHMISGLDTRNKTPTVTALYEAVRYFRGMQVLEGKEVPPYWNVAQDKYVYPNRNASNEKTYTNGGYVTKTREKTTWCSSTSTDWKCDRLIAGSCRDETRNSLRTTRNSKIPNCSAVPGANIVTYDSCRTYKDTRKTVCVEYDLTGTECLRTTTTGSRTCVDWEKRIDNDKSDVPRNCYFEDDRLWEVRPYEECQYAYDEEYQALQGDPTYRSPIEHMCQPNYIVLLSDGAPSSNINKGTIDDLLRAGGFEPPPATSNDCEDLTALDLNDYGKCGPDLVRFLREYDQSSALPGNQTVTTYTIGFSLAGVPEAQTYLRRLSEVGGGDYYDADSPESLVAVFQRIIEEISADNATFVVPSTAIDPNNLLANREEVYLSLFSPSDYPRWVGNIKGYYLGDAGYEDLNREKATDASGTIFLAGKQSFWTATPEVTALDGGLAGKLADVRTVYTYTGPDNFSSAVNLNSNEQRLRVANDSANGGTLSNALLGLDLTASSADRQALIEWAQSDEIGVGESLHTTPVFVPYTIPGNTAGAATQYVLFSVTNDGYLHAQDVTENGASGGRELFAFVPKELLPNLEKMKRNSTAENKLYGLDGGIAMWYEDANGDGVIDKAAGDHVRLYFGMRRGGSNYYALDVTDLSNPRLLWTIKSGDPGFKRLGQTWSKPVLTRMKVAESGDNDDERYVLVFAGGYDLHQDDKEVRSYDYIGNSLYIVDAQTGALLWSAAGPAEALISVLQAEIDDLEDTDSGIPFLETELARVGTEQTTAENADPLDPVLVANLMQEADSIANEIEAAKVQLADLQSALAVAEADDTQYDVSVATMLYSIPSDVRMIDVDANGLADRLYVGDMGGQIWRVDFPGGLQDGTDANGTAITYPGLGDNSSSKAAVYQLAQLSGSDAANSRRFYYPPSVAKVLDGGHYRLSVSIGSGYRAHPLQATIRDRFYALKDTLDTAPATAMTESNLVDMTDNAINEGSTAEQSVLRNSLANGSGWYIVLSSGEKALARPLTFENKVMFTTFNPGIQSANADCSAGFGPESRFYMVDLLDASPVKQLAEAVDLDGDGVPDPVVSGLTASDRSVTLLNPIIPAEPYVVHTPPTQQGGSTVAGETCVNVGSECMERVSRSLKLLRWRDKRL